MKSKNQSKTQDVEVTYTPNYEIVRGYSPNEIWDIPMNPSRKSTRIEDNDSKILLYDEHFRMISKYMVTYDRLMEFETAEEEDKYIMLYGKIPSERVTEEVDEDFVTPANNILTLRMSFEEDYYKIMMEHNSPLATVLNFKTRNECEEIFNKLVKWKVKADLNKSLA